MRAGRLKIRAKPQPITQAMRRAVALYLTSRECVARDVGFLLLHEGTGDGADMVVFTRGDMFLVGIAIAGRGPGPAISRQSKRVRDLGQSYHLIEAETPAHAVEQLARLIDGTSQ